MLNVGVVGATGVVGQTFISLMENRKFPIKELRPFASEKSAGNQLNCQGKEWIIQALTDGCFDGLDLVFFSSGDDISKEWAPKAAQAGAIAIDNSAAFRMSSDHHLIVPEINSHLLPQGKSPMVIANPNCSTIQLVLALAPLSKDFGIEQVHVATYQAVSGAGKDGIEELKQQTQAKLNEQSGNNKVFPHDIAFNCLPHIGSFDDQGFCSEEVKIMKETKKILDQPDINVSAFTVRVPAYNVHSEAVWVKLKTDVSKEQFIQSLQAGKGLTVVEQTEPHIYPHQSEVSGKDDVYVGRIHKDMDNPNTWIMWVVGDNLLKGAALNGIQIAEHIFKVPVTF